MRRRSRTLIIIPAYNEEDALPGVLQELTEVVPEHDVLVVVDGATDGTAEAARRGAAIVAELPYNLGVGGALRTGFRYAAAHGYERAVQFDGDGQHNPAEIKTLLDALDDGAQLVVGTRFAETASDYQVGVVRRGAMGLLRFSFQLLSGHRFTDTSSGFKAFSAPVIQYFSRTYPVEYLSDTVEALLLACLAGFVVVEVPTTMRYRSAGAPSTRNLRLVYHYLRLLIVMVSSASLRRRPVL